MVYGDFTDLTAGDEHLYVYTRTLNETTWLIVLNHSNEPREYFLQKEHQATTKELIIANYDIDELELGASFIMQPHEARIYKIKR
jgi:oligo-1,6-glucosidase